MCAFWVTAFRERYGSDNQNNITIIIVKREWQHGIAVQSNAAIGLSYPPTARLRRLGCSVPGRCRNDAGTQPCRPTRE